MKNRLEGELISIAHRILKLKNKSELIQLQQETLQLYEKLSVLRFVEENYEDPMVEIPSDMDGKLENSDIEDKKNEFQPENVSKTQENDKNLDIEENTTNFEAELSNERPEIEEKISESILIENSTAVEENFQEKKTENVANNTINFEDFEAQLSNAKPEKAPTIFGEEIIHEEPKESVLITETEFSQTQKDGKTTKKDFDIRLNDRVGFEFHLFNGETENFQRVISQLSTFETFEQAKDFIENKVKPDYDNWFMKEEYESRFMKIIENSFM